MVNRFGSPTAGPGAQADRCGRALPGHAVIVFNGAAVAGFIFALCVDTRSCCQRSGVAHSSVRVVRDLLMLVSQRALRDLAESRNGRLRALSLATADPWDVRVGVPT